MWPPDQARRAPVGDFPPRWASAWGDDRFGLWADLVVGGVAQRMRWIEPTGPDGFLMGSTIEELQSIQLAVPAGLMKDAGWRRIAVEAPRHRVAIGQGFWLADTPCTQIFWLAVTGVVKHGLLMEVTDEPTKPVTEVSWHDVVERFLLGFQEHQLPLDHDQACLPTEAQWEYACRAGSDAAYHWGDAFDQSRANVRHASGALMRTSVVKSYEPNSWGLYDMHGNVWEWCADGMRDYTQARAIDPRGPEIPGHPRVLRGGSWLGEPALARSACRSRNVPNARKPFNGFRFALKSSGQRLAGLDGSHSVRGHGPPQSP